MAQPTYYLLQSQAGPAITFAGFQKTLQASPLNLLDKNQHWAVETDAAHGAGSFVSSRNGNYVFDVSQNVAKEDQPIIAYTKKDSGNTNQKFNVNFTEDKAGDIETLLKTSFVVTAVNGAFVLAAAKSPLSQEQSFIFVPAPHEFTIKVINKTDGKVTAQFTNAPASETNATISVDSNAQYSGTYLQGAILEFKDASGKVLRTLRVTEDATVEFDSAPPTPVDLGEPGQFLLYNPGQGIGRVVGFSADGKLTVEKLNKNWWKTFTLIASGDFRGVKQNDAILYAPANAGNGCIVDFAADGTGVVLSAFSNGIGAWWTTWKYMVSGNFRGRGAADVFLHESAQHAPKGISTIVSWSSAGVYNSVKNTPDFGLFNAFVAGQFLGTSSDQLVAYNTTTGEGYLVGYGADGIVNLKVALPAWAHKATHIVGGNFRGIQGKVDLLIYDRSTGTGRLIGFAANGTSDLVVEIGGGRTTWDFLVTGDFRGTGRDDLVLYSRQDGQADLVGFGNDGKQNFDVTSPGWRHTWDLVAVSDRYTKAQGGQSQILLYEKDNGSADLVIWNKAANGLSVDAQYKNWEVNSSILIPL
eukprot:Phypoly_transcript_06292.p1 GENE.Phypoly_transcript_06292~~Phypoly_transcript_06292.p1  ORF type:complete len:594 (+),score=113.47 Phypoly_transcript_06292:35-1783(+)